MKITKKSKKFNATFESLQESADWIKNIPDNQYSKTHHRTHDKKWAGGLWEDMIKQIECGNEERTAKMVDAVDKIKTLASVKPVGYRRDVTGEFFDVGLVVSGEPEQWYEEEERPAFETIDIIVNRTEACGVSTTEVRRRGAAVLALVDILSESYLVNVKIVNVEDYCGKTYTFEVNFDNKPFDRDAFAFAVTSPMFNRRLAFSWLEKATGERKCPGYGRPADLPEKEIGDALYFGSSSWDYQFKEWFKTDEKAAEYVESVLKKYNVDID